MTRTRTLRTIAGMLALALVLGFAAGCSALVSGESASDGSGTMGSAPSVGATPEEYPSPESQASDSAAPRGDVANVADEDRLIIRSKTLRLEVESTSESVGSIRALAATHGGTVTDLQVASDTDDPVYYYDESGYSSAALRGWVTVRVPVEGFEAFIAASSALGTVKFQSEASEDVTQQHVDMAARLENLRAEEVRLREFFDAAKNVTEMLAIESELSRVRGEIESLDAQVKYLERQAAMATVTIELTEPRDIVRPDGESWGFTDAITTGIRGAAGVVKVAITFIIATAPLWVLGVIASFVLRAIVRRRRGKRSESGTADSAIAIAESTPENDTTA